MNQAPYLVFYRRSDIREIGIFKYTEEADGFGYYADEDGQGFFLDTIKKYPHLFNLMNTKEEAEQFIKEQKFIHKYGTNKGDKGAFHCPNCNYGFDSMPQEFYGSEGLEDFTERMTCLCGQKLTVEVEYIPKYTVTKN